jgi:hypothetical protein
VLSTGPRKVAKNAGHRRADAKHRALAAGGNDDQRDAQRQRAEHQPPPLLFLP